MRTPDAASDLTPARITRGQACDEPAWIELRAGGTTVQFDPANDWIRRLRVADREVINALYGAVRDRNWATIPPKVLGLQVDQLAETFRVSFEVACVSAAAHF